ncbi:MAG: pyrimidine-nucleoside phosphorylase, partial [Candidatus Bipolaricaulia bacterium]
LRGEGPDDLASLCCELGAELLLFAGEVKDRSEALDRLRDRLRDGSALEKLRELVLEQGGNVATLDDPSLLPRASRRVEARAAAAGTVSALNALAIGRAANVLGAGRQTAEDDIDPAVGVELRAKIGDRVEEDQLLALLHVNDEAHLDEACSMVESAYEIDETGAAHEPPPLIVERILARPSDR